jgi:hypothetical protein
MIILTMYASIKSTALTRNYFSTMYPNRLIPFLLIVVILVSAVVCSLRVAYAQNAPLPAPVRTWTSNGHTRYYVDSVGGNDANDGTSAARAWQTLANVNSGTFTTGDWILLKCGSHWNSAFFPGGSGSYRHPVKITSYGSGPAPSLDAQGQVLATVYIHNGEYWDIGNLDIANTSPTPVPFLRGVEVSLTDFGTAHDITLHDLYIHNISSTLDKGNGGSGIFADNRGDKIPSCFDGLLIQNCHVAHVDRNGITMDSGYWDRTKWFPSHNVVIRDNLLEDIGGDCIVAIGCDGALIEYNNVHGGRQRAPDWASGIWVWSCDNSILQYNEIDGMRGVMDAQGFDADWNTRNTIIQYNYSHDNEGGFVMMCNNGGVKPPTNIGNDGSIVRYNISQNDRFRTITFSGPVTNAQVYDNDIYCDATHTPLLVFDWNWGNTWPDHLTFTNNIFDFAGQAHFELGGGTILIFDHNDWNGTFVDRPTDIDAITKDPLFKSPGTATDDPKTLAGYQLQTGSPCLSAGAPIANNGGLDYWGYELSPSNPPDIGAE